ncbi:hypothetical protein QJS10_CPB22g01399 [Acorus calamus]|uniref:C-terminal processing peptidase n=1 Tax=Acorus calamus TaxID=4465 RepID=A0AAV9C2N4_ACOCL|nr:hypothetical protein QJS10_CPB22g01399 [Acorus calamus]
MEALLRPNPMFPLRNPSTSRPRQQNLVCSYGGFKSSDHQKPTTVRSLKKGLVGLAAAAAVSLASATATASDSPALAESLTVAFPVSRARERTLVEVWGLIRESFVDPTFNHQAAADDGGDVPLKSADAAYNKVVMSCVDGSPAARAGIHEGDELIEIDGESLDGMNGEAAAQKLRGRAGTTVTVKVHSVTGFGSGSGLREVNLPREVIRISPLSCAVISHRSPDGHELKTGYVRLSAFSQTAATEMEYAIQEMGNQGVESYILDLRNNPGGLVKSGLDVAQIWLDGDETLVNTIDREGNMFPINMVNGHALTHDPLVVLVNEGSASASEILAGALHDNGRAVLVGHRTFGKGKIQSVTELHDGSALFITVAKYLSPALHEIDKVGITPDVQCTPEALASPKTFHLKGRGMEPSLEADSCIMIAEHELEVQETKGSAS